MSGERLTTPERKVATTIARRLGTVGLTSSGVEKPDPTQDQLLIDLGRDHAANPKDTLAVAREYLMVIGSNENLSPQEKEKLLDTQLDVVFDLTIKLDHLAFPPTKPGEVRKGVPDYIPDGFVDMGKDENVDPANREREQILVDKRDILTKYKPFLKDLLSRDYSRIDLQTKKRHLAIETAKEIYSSLEFNAAASDMGGDVVRLSKVPEGVCRHQGMTFQVLCQTLGLKSRVLKSYRDGERHSANMVRFNDQWYIFDVTNPDYQLDDSGQKRWRPGAFAVDEPPMSGEMKKYSVRGKFSGEDHTYLAHDNMYWRIES